jgi:tRNA threonylcarbamoyladenosine biosynthesis protein TsaE
VDLYRISGAQEALGLGLADYVDDESAVTLIEWPERAKELFPEERLWVLIRHIESRKRILLMSAQGARYETLLREFRKRAFGV